MNTIHFHGELVIIERKTKPENLKRVETTSDIKLADSEVTGNDHMLKHVPGLEVWSDEAADKFFVSTKEDTKIYCKIADRHSDLVLKGGHCYEIGKAQEWDHISRERRNVLD